MLKSVTVKDYMSANLVTLTPNTDVLKAIHLLLENGISGAPVVDEHGSLVGVLSEKDCMKVALNASYFEEGAGQVGEYMSASVESVDLDTSIVDAAERFLNTVYRFFPVMEENRLVGRITRADVLRSLEVLW